MYEPIGEEAVDVVPVKPRRRKRAAAGGGKKVAVVALIILLLAIVALAIALPIVLTRRTQQNALRDANGNLIPNASTGAQRSLITGPGASANGTPNGIPNGASNVAPNTATDPNGGIGGSNPGSAFAVAPVNPDRNTGSNVFCYRNPITGQFMDGAYLATGGTSTEDGTTRTEVESCGSGSTMFLVTSQLVICNSPCLTPSWQALDQGIIEMPIWNQQYVCRGDQVYENRLSPRFTFYFRFAGFVQEQRITRCDTNDAWWVPNIELRYCQSQEIVACQLSSLARVVPRGIPTDVPGLPAAGVSTVPRPVCRMNGAVLESYFATGVITNSYVWELIRFVDQVQVTLCNQRQIPTAPRLMIFVDDMVPCPLDVTANCNIAAGILLTSTPTA